MAADDGCGIAEDGCFHDLTWMHDGGIEAANVDCGNVCWLVLRVEAHHDKVLTINLSNVVFEKP